MNLVFTISPTKKRNKAIYIFFVKKSIMLRINLVSQCYKFCIGRREQILISKSRILLKTQEERVFRYVTKARP